MELIELKIGDVVKKYNHEESDDLYNNPSSFSIKNCDHLNEILIGDNELMSINEVELTSRIEYSLLNESIFQNLPYSKLAINHSTKQEVFLYQVYSN